MKSEKQSARDKNKLLKMIFLFAAKSLGREEFSFERNHFYLSDKLLIHESEIHESVDSRKRYIGVVSGKIPLLHYIFICD